MPYPSRAVFPPTCNLPRVVKHQANSPTKLHRSQDVLSEAGAPLYGQIVLSGAFRLRSPVSADSAWPFYVVTTAVVTLRWQRVGSYESSSKPHRRWGGAAPDSLLSSLHGLCQHRA